MFSTFTKISDTTVWPILDYCSSVWSYKKHQYATKIKNIIEHRDIFRGTQNAPDLAVKGEMGWVLAEYMHYLSML